MTETDSCYIIRRATLNDVLAIATVHVRSWQSSYQGVLPEDVLAGLSIERRVQAWTCNLSEQRHITVVAATPNDQVVGFCDAGPNRDESHAFRGEIYSIYLLEEAKRKGMGRALFKEAGAWLEQNDLS